MRLIRIVTIFIIIISFPFTISCAILKPSTSSEKQKKMNINMDVKDKYAQQLIRFLIEGYQKEKSDVEIKVNSPLDNNQLKDDIIKGNVDLLFITREKMMELSRDGVISDMSETYTKNKISDKYYNIVSSYGRIGDKHYGIALMPYTIEIFYNTEALKKIGANEPKKAEDIIEVFKKLNENKIEVPIFLNEGVDIKNAAVSILFNDLIDPESAEKIFDSGKENYSSLKVQEVFDKVNALVQQNNISEDTFEVASDSTVERLENGDVPVMIGLSYVYKNLKKDTKVNVIEKYSDSKVKSGFPVIANSIVSVAANSKNEEVVNDFIEYIFSDDTQKKLAKEGYITGNKKANEEIKKTAIGKKICSHLEESNNNIFYMYNFPKKFHSYFDTTITHILEKKHTGKEWSEILNSIYK